MVEELADDYVNYIKQLEFPREIHPICTNIDEILTRLDELESSILIIKNTSAATPIPNIVECKSGFQTYFDKIDKLQQVIDVINGNLTALEQNVTKAEEELGYNDNSGFKGLFKPFLDKVVKTERTRNNASIERNDPQFQPTHIFKASDFFDESN